ncbi:hypothetical protein HMPREF0880_04593 [Yokenella regensburgei ATCC 43003]|nr:hypothetical protein HMPREF0880_04593 [Yokenella regensburgei ATCC 43003]
MDGSRVTSPALAIIGADASKIAAIISDLNILFSSTNGAVSGLLAQYYVEVNPRIIGNTLKHVLAALFAKTVLFLFTGSYTRPFCTICFPLPFYGAFWKVISLLQYSQLTVQGKEQGHATDIHHR